MTWTSVLIFWLVALCAYCAIRIAWLKFQLRIVREFQVRSIARMLQSIPQVERSKDEDPLDDDVIL